MNTELQALSEAGRHLVALTEMHARDFVAQADQHDRDSSFPQENIEALKSSGVMGATVPRQLGGLGVESVHDYVVGSNRLGRGDGSTALAVNMHMFRTWFITRAWREATAVGDEGRAGHWEQLLRKIAAGQTVIAAILTEPGIDHLHLRTEATRVQGGWSLTGHKSFGTGSPAADLLGIVCRYRDDRGDWRFALAHVPTQSPGVEVKNNWDALGMRGSGSHDVVFTNSFVPEGDFVDTGRWGEYNERYLAGNAVGTLGLVAVFLGIAEAARECAVSLIRGRRRGEQSRAMAERFAIQHSVAEIEIDLAASRAMVDRTGNAMDAFFEAHPQGSLPMDELHELMKDFQCTKWFVTRKAIEIVDRALTLSGGAGYLTRNQLSRLYRDVRAGPFMQPFSPNEAFEYIGKVTLGLDPVIEL